MKELRFNMLGEGTAIFQQSFPVSKAESSKGSTNFRKLHASHVLKKGKTSILSLLCLSVKSTLHAFILGISTRHG